MKKSELIFNLFSVPLDALMLVAAGVVSFYLRLHTVHLVGPIIYNLQIGTFLKLVYFVVPFLLLIFAVLGLYNLRGTRRFGQEFLKIVIGISVGLFFVIILFFFNQSLFPSRFIVLAAWGFAILFVVLGRLAVKLLQELAFRMGYGLHRLVIIDGNNRESEILQRILNNRSFGYRVLQEFSYSEDIKQKLQELYTSKRFDEIMQTNPTLTDAQNLKLVEFARNKGIQYSFVPNLFEVQRNSIEMNEFRGIPIISLKNSPLDGWGRVAKRIFDIVVSAFCLIITSPLFLVVYLWVRLDSKGPGIYRQIRGGHKKDFEFYKFRSMYFHLSTGLGNQEAERVREELWKVNTRGGGESPFLKMKNDPRVTKVGRFIRRSKLDELPQFWNVLRGDMSMVGPRAHMIEEVVRYRDSYPRMFSIKPGIFGVSQVAQITWPDLPFDEEIRLNTYYIENWSLWLDIKTLATSFYLLFFAKKPKEDY